MSRMFQTLPLLLGGVSQKPDTEMAANEVKRMDNCLLSRTDGVRMRPPTQHMGVVDPDISDMPASPFVHTVKRAADDIYSIIVFNGELFVYNSLTGAQKQVLTPHGMEYLTTVNGLRATTIGDVTVLVNRDTVVQKVARRNEKMVYEAMVYVKNAQYSNTYKLDFGGGNIVNYTTAALDDKNANKTLATEDVAIGIYGAMKTNSFFDLYFDAVFYGASVLVTRKDKQDFGLQVTDSLAGQGLILIKNTVQKFEDLPPKARAGMVVKVSGDPLTAKDDYWVKYEEVDKWNQDVGGVWREVPAPSSSEGLDPDTMPWALTRYGSPIGIRTVLKDPLAPVITDDPEVTATKSFNLGNKAAGVLLTADEETTPHIILTSDDIGDDGQGVMYVYLDVDNAQNPYVEDCVVDLWGWNSALETPAYSVLDEIGVSGGERKNNLMLRTPLRLWDAGKEFWVQIHTGASPSFTPRVFIHPGTHPTHPGFKMDWSPRTKVTYPVDALYPEGHQESLRVALFNPAGDEPEYFLVATVQVPTGETWTAQQLAEEMTYEVNLQAGSLPVEFLYASAVTGEANALHIILSGNRDLDPWFGGYPYGSDNLQGGWVYVTREYLNDSEVCFLDSEDGWALDELVGMTLKNITDGSTGTISMNDANFIKVADLDGGVRNTFEPGDRVEIIGTDGEYYLFDRIDWTKRLSGSDESVPLPSFVGKRLNEVFFYKNRLSFCCGESVVTSASGDVFRFFRRTATDILDDDPIDVTSAHQNIAAFGAAVNWKERLVLFSDSGHQFVFEGEPTLTPKTAAIRHIGSHPCTLRVRPMTVGDQLFFTRATAGYTRVLEMYLDGDGKAQTRDLTKNVPQYIAGSIVEMTGDSNVGSLFFLTNNSNLQDTLFVWTYDKGEDGSLLMGAWHKWTFGPTTGDTTNTKPRIFTLGMVDGYLYMVVVRKGHPVYGQEGVMLERINLTTPTDTSQLHWDRYNLANIASVYGMWISLPTIYPRDDNGNAITDGALKLTYVNLNYHRVGSIQLRGMTTASPIQFFVNRFFPGTPGVSGRLRLPLMSKNTGATIDITGSHAAGCGFTTISWEGDYHHSRR